MVGTTGCKTRDAAMNYRMQNRHRSIGMSDRAAANALNGGGNCPTRTSNKTTKPGADADMWKDLQVASESGRGITKPELKSIVQTHQRNGVLNAGQRRALSNAVAAALFARQTPGALAQKLGQGAQLADIC